VSPFVVRNNRDNEMSKKAEMLRSPHPHQQLSSSSLSNSESGEQSDGSVNLSTLMQQGTSGAVGGNAGGANNMGFMADWLSPDTVDWRNSLPGMMSLNAMGLQPNSRGVLGLSDVTLPYSAMQHMYTSPEQLHAAFAAQQQVLAHQQQAHARALSQQQEGNGSGTSSQSSSASSSTDDTSENLNKQRGRSKAAASPQQLLNSLMQAQGMLQGISSHPGFGQSLAQMKPGSALANQNLANLRPRVGMGLHSTDSREGGVLDSVERERSGSPSPPTLSLSLTSLSPVVPPPLSVQTCANSENTSLIRGDDVRLTAASEGHAFETPHVMENNTEMSSAMEWDQGTAQGRDNESTPLEASVTIPEKPSPDLTE
jgi:hypothetical protein